MRALRARAFRAGRPGIPLAPRRFGGTARSGRHRGTTLEVRHRGASGVGASGHASHASVSGLNAPQHHAGHRHHAQPGGTGRHGSRHTSKGVRTRHGRRQPVDLAVAPLEVVVDDPFADPATDPFADPFGGGVDSVTGQPVIDEADMTDPLPFTDAEH